MVRRARLLAVAAYVVATTGLLVPSAPASADTCAGADGVTVVVDFHELGGGVQSACVADGGGRTAGSLLQAAGFALDYVQRQPGFVCRISGLPADDPCVNTPPADAYWGLYWSDGSSGRWTYATLGAGSQTAPEGGSVAFSWTGSSGRSLPGTAPAVHAAVPAPTPSAKPSRKPSSAPSATPSGTPSAEPSVTPTSEPAASATPSRTRSPKPSATPTPTPTDTPTPVPSPTTESPGEPTPTAADPDDDGLPTWVGPVVVAVLFAAGAAVAVVRRRRASS